MFSLMYFSDDHLLEKDAFELERLFKLVVSKKFSWFSKHFWLLSLILMEVMLGGSCLIFFTRFQDCI